MELQIVARVRPLPSNSTPQYSRSTRVQLGRFSLSQIVMSYVCNIGHNFKLAPEGPTKVRFINLDGIGNMYLI